jgi:aminopeptidase N
MNSRPGLRSLAFILLCFPFSAEGQKQLTHDDTLRGSITKERAWWDLKYYQLDVHVDPVKEMLSGKVTVMFSVLEPDQVLQIDLQPPLQITQVVQGKKKLPFTRKGKNAYLITLSSKAKKNETVSIDVYYRGTPIKAVNPPWQGGVQWTKSGDGSPFIATSCQGLGASAWWPCKDHMYDEPDSMLISVTVPQELMDVSNGRLRKVQTNKDKTKTYHWFVGSPINNYGVNLNIGKYVHYSDTLLGEKGKLDLDFYVLPENLEKAKVQFSQAKLMLKAFEYWFGPYPFYQDGYKLVEAPYLGMEHQSSITYGNEFRNGYRGRDLSGTGWGLKWDFIIIHESGHEWFANNITYKDIADMWIHESFTNYSESLYIEYYFGKEAATDYCVGTRLAIRNDIPIIGQYDVNKSGSGDMYYKGGNMLHTIRHSIANDVQFRSILRGLNSEFYHQTVATAQIENYVSKESGMDFSKVFDQYLRTTKIPQFEYYFKGDELFYRWSNVVPGFNLKMPIQTLAYRGALQPTESWQQIKLPQGRNFDVKGLEREFYISLKEVKQ